MDLQLNNLHVLITGGSKGIGLACAQGFMREGARVSLVSRSAAHLDAALAQLSGEFADATSRVALCMADLRDSAQAAQALHAAEQRFGAVDVLVNSAGAAKRTPPDELNAQAWHDAMDAKFFTTIHMLDIVVKQMGARGKGAIVNIVGAGGKTASPVHMPGGAANAALMLVSAGMAAAYGPRGVRVNAVNPGATHTGRLAQGLEAAAKLANTSVDAALANMTKNVPLGRLAQPDEIANAVLFLASPRASYVTGVVMTMDGAANPMVV